jgi:hypothetical protein
MGFSKQFMANEIAKIKSLKKQVILTKGSDNNMLSGVNSIERDKCIERGRTP